ncbi:MAG: DUF389 domain-containing protein [Methylicorpusculum sp.]|uniref:DUF389 domain-containing protein n=1 Tax=Methylicorpusculum sp. TaxID=2713644 RepID=UPI002722F616|nr:DUF389 domain-containing protein [Methylicorpusculum sp.]MDO8846519.1 DUF389 domain-containing protein [Methylicorpusculum sp.]MDO8939906.1 DUF389 domain-containing protein [Methylicorpusculum sp.]MDP2204370.1 DUF389 domain-containing protein [Methylicorpusculum sp.]
MITSGSDKDSELLRIQAARADITLNAQFDKAFIIMNALSAIIASYGLLADSSSGVIGAMLVAMLLGPIAGLSLSLVDGNHPLLRQSLLSLLGGTGIVVLCAFIIGFLHTDIPAGNELLGRTHPNYLDLMIALAGGAVGAYAVITPRIVNAVVGVAIATALVPPLCSGTIFLARGELDNAFGAYLLAFANIVAIQFSFSIVLWLSGFRKATDQFFRSKKVVWLNGVSLVLITLLFVVLGANTKEVIGKMLFETNARKILLDELKAYRGAQLLSLRIDNDDGKNIIRAQVNSPLDFTAQDVAKFESKFPVAPNNLPSELRLRHVKVKVMTRSGDRYDIQLSQKDGATDNSP